SLPRSTAIFAKTVLQEYWSAVRMVAFLQGADPRLTALVRDTPGFGRLAAQELLAVLDGGPHRTVQGELPHLEARESTGPCPRD
ncbi:hypothetical protein ABT366_38485, partial [Streptomyces lydicus]